MSVPPNTKMSELSVWGRFKKRVSFKLVDGHQLHIQPFLSLEEADTQWRWIWSQAASPKDHWKPVPCVCYALHHPQPLCWWRIQSAPALLLLRQIPYRELAMSSWVKHTAGADMGNLLENWQLRGAWPSLPCWMDTNWVLVHVLQYCICQGSQSLTWLFGCTHPAVE